VGWCEYWVLDGGGGGGWGGVGGGGGGGEIPGFRSQVMLTACSELL
jgi:hypothetical protein